MSTSTSNTIYKIPVLPAGKAPCRKYALALEHAIASDGCTGVTEMYHDCCIYHDLGYRFHIDIYGNPVDRDQTDYNFRCNIHDRSKLKWFNPVGWWRYAGVRWFGNKFYSIYPKEFTTFTFTGEK